jgi:DNA polymerase III delta' subunit
MALNWTVFGHQKQIEFMTRAVKAGRLAHALAFCGPEGVGKRTLAKNLAQILLCDLGTGCGACPQCKSLSAGLHPDFLSLASDDTIKIEQVRQLVYSLSLKPYQAKYKVAVVDRAEDMTTEAANALLKSMEEPKPHTIIILITANPYRLLPTIVSRVQKINFGLVAQADYQPLIPAHLSAEQKQALETFAAGRPGVALDIVNDPDRLGQLQHMERQYRNFARGTARDRFRVAADLAELDNPQIREALSFWLANLERELTANVDQHLIQKIEAVAEAQTLLAANVNAKLLLTNIMLD